MFIQRFKPWASSSKSLFLQNHEQTVKLLELLALELSFPECFSIRNAGVVAVGKDDVAVDVKDFARFVAAVLALLCVFVYRRNTQTALRHAREQPQPETTVFARGFHRIITIPVLCREAEVAVALELLVCHVCMRQGVCKFLGAVFVPVQFVLELFDRGKEINAVWAAVAGRRSRSC